MFEPFQLPFIQRAALEIVLLAPIAGLLGAQIVLRGLAFFTHGIGAATFPGLVVAGPAGVPPALAALGVGGTFAGLLERLARRRGMSYDVATALLLVAALAAGVILASDVFESGAEIDQLLFGSLLAIGSTQLWATAAALLAVLGAALVCRRSWITTGFEARGDGSATAPSGAGSTLADRVLVAAIAVAVVVSLDAAGAMLVGAILVIPPATARLFAPSVVALEVGAAGVAAVEGLAGLLIAFWLDVPPGPAIAVLGGAVFAASLAGRFLTMRPRSAVGAG